MKRSHKRVCGTLLAVLLFIIAALMLWFRLPYAPLKDAFEADVLRLKARQPEAEGVLTRTDAADLPEVLQRYLAHCGYFDRPQMRWMTVHYEDVAFVQNPDTPPLTIDYTQVNTVSEPARLAFIDSSLYGVPFQGYDYYQDGVGGMKGVLGKLVTLFDQRGTEMDRAALVTYLAESLFAPAILLQDNVSCETIDDHHMRATITAYDETVSGVFTFNDAGEMIRFTTNDRSYATGDGKAVLYPWSAVCGDYRLNENGLRQPTTFRAVWHLPEGDCVYFDGKVSAITYDD